MASNFKLILLSVLLSSFNFPTAKAQDPNPAFIYQNCTANQTVANTTYQMDIRSLFSSLSSNATTKTFYNNTVASRNSSDPVYGLFMCRGDVPSQLCRQCVVNATQKLSSDSECSLSKQAVIWYDECMVRYSNISFFTTVALRPGVFMWNTANISNQESFRRLLSDTMNQTADKAANSPTGNRYATKEANISEFQRLYCLAQCTQDLSPQACTTCFANAIGLLPRCCEGKQGGRVLLPSCNIRYELYPFYRVTNETTGGLVPETKYPQIDSKYSEDPGYISHNCSSNETIAADSAFQSNLKTLLSELSSNATGGNEFQIEVGTLYGLFTCRGDIPRRLCGLCVQNATDKIVSECRLSREAIIWYNHCWLRYSHRNFFSTVDTSPRFERLNITNSFSIAQNSFSFTLSTNLAKMANEAGNKGERYQTGTLKLNDYQTLYILAQCTRDLSSNDCGGCLRDVIGSSIPWSRLGSVGGRVLYPSCNLRFEPFKFYDLMPDPATPPPTGKRKGRSQTIILIVVPIAIGLAILLSCGCYFLRGKIRKNYRTILRENFGDESTILEPLQFNLTIIKAATNNFSHVNKIGKGGFGEVFKGILIDGRHIAVKRLSTTSRQGVEEFKNEILLIAKLQHRNLVAFIGFCLDEQEKILIYEYVPNKSLDYFLFDTKAQKVLSWSERYKIIGGIARGILYLHEYSRLKVIHRDLKPSNILLDENMNPKISDFGLARIIEIDQQEGSTNRIIGTYGYMSPEYAILGQFSEKSDVFSFGVMILEIITGKKNIGSYESHHVRDGLLSYAWRQWKDQEPLNILDPKLRENYSEIEVIKCIQLGLLCVQENPDARPTMVALVSYLSSHSIELPFPQEPAFFMHDRMDLNIVAQESSSSQSANSSIPLSINEMSISKFYPR